MTNDLKLMYAMKHKKPIDKLKRNCHDFYQL